MLGHIAVPTMPSFTDEKSLSTSPVINFSLQGSSLPILDSLNLKISNYRLSVRSLPVSCAVHLHWTQCFLDIEIENQNRLLCIRKRNGREERKKMEVEEREALP
jgi:hypothetical protein